MRVIVLSYWFCPKCEVPITVMSSKLLVTMTCPHCQSVLTFSTSRERDQCHAELTIQLEDAELGPIVGMN